MSLFKHAILLINFVIIRRWDKSRFGNQDMVGVGTLTVEDVGGHAGAAGIAGSKTAAGGKSEMNVLIGFVCQRLFSYPGCAKK